MGRSFRSKQGALQKVAMIAGAAVAASALEALACITAPPPDLPVLGHRPTVNHASVEPPEGLIVDWAAGGAEGFVVPVLVEAAGDPFSWVVVVDGVAGQVTPVTPNDDGGVALVSFTVGLPLTVTCPHTIEFWVARGFFIDITKLDASGADVVTWTYYNGGPGGPAGCPPIDAGSGLLPEASGDALPIPPSEGGGDL